MRSRASIEAEITSLEDEELAEEERALCGSLANFVRLAWPVIEPGQPYVHGAHIDFVCEHLEAVSRGEIRRLLINIPPGTSKSTICGVFWPMWEWTRQPSLRYVGVSHEQTLGIRDNLKCRRLASSEWYQQLWGDKVRLTKDQNEKLNFENAATGFRQVATPSNITGRRGDRVICDDLLSVENANSDLDRDRVNLWYRESLPTRLNNPDRSAIINVMQRVHENDVSGLIIAQDMGYEHIMLPMRFEPDRRCVTVIGRDWRTEPGELLFPARFSEPVVDELERSMGSYAASGQLQQRPVPREGGLFKRAWFAGKIIDPRALPASGLAYCRAWDFAASADKAGTDPDWSTGGLMARRGPEYFVLGMERLRATAGEVQQTVLSRAEVDPRGCIIRIPQDPGQAGKGQVQSYVTKLAGYNLKAVTTTGRGNKLARATPVAIQAEYGHLWFVNSAPLEEGIDPWIETLIDELCTFPSGRHDDQVDAIADAFDELALGSNVNFDFASTGTRLTDAAVQPHDEQRNRDIEPDLSGAGFGSVGSNLWGINR